MRARHCKVCGGELCRSEASAGPGVLVNYMVARYRCAKHTILSCVGPCVLWVLGMVWGCVC